MKGGYGGAGVFYLMGAGEVEVDGQAGRQAKACATGVDDQVIDGDGGRVD